MKLKFILCAKMTKPPEIPPILHNKKREKTFMVHILYICLRLYRTSTHII